MKFKMLKVMAAGLMAGVLFAESAISLAVFEENKNKEEMHRLVDESMNKLDYVSFEEMLNIHTGTIEKPKALPVVIGKKEDAAKNLVTTKSIQASAGNIPVYAAKSNATVKTSKAFFKQLHDNLTARKTNFTITYKGKYSDIYKEDVEAMFQKAWNQDDKTTSDDFDYLYPNIKTYGFSIPSYSNTESIFYFRISYRESAAQMKKVNKKVKSVLKSLKISNLSDKEKVKKIHDYIVNLFSYDRTLTRFTAYDGLVSSKHTTVCQGYAVLMYKMLTDAGVSCRYVTGNAGEAHAWNIVKIGNKWYHLDATWDDPVSSVPQLSYDYFLIGSKTMAEDHKLDAEYRTASFKKKYPINTRDFVWKDTSTKPQEQVDEVVAKKQKFNKQVVISLNKMLDYENAGKLNQKMYDVYKEIVTGVFTDMNDKLFLSMYEDDDPQGIFKIVLNSANSKIKKDIIEPLEEYIDSKEFEDAYVNAVLENYTLKQWEKLSDDEKEEVVGQYMEVEFEKKLQELSMENSEKIISEILKEVQ